MVAACKNYVTDRGLVRVWYQPRQPLIEKLKVCLKLNTEYQKSFQRTKKRIAKNPNQKPFEFSEMYIFGKFDAFCKRIHKVGAEKYSIISRPVYVSLLCWTLYMVFGVEGLCVIQVWGGAPK